MQLADAREAYRTFSAAASDRIRQLAYGAIAIIWLLNEGRESSLLFQPLWLPLALVVATLACDLLQYVYATAAWGFFARAKERRIQDPQTTVFAAPNFINWPTLTFFWAKTLLIAATYLKLLHVIAQLIGGDI